jgi:hypothetical protein
MTSQNSSSIERTHGTSTISGGLICFTFALAMRNTQGRFRPFWMN